MTVEEILIEAFELGLREEVIARVNTLKKESNKPLPQIDYYELAYRDIITNRTT